MVPHSAVTLEGSELQSITLGTLSSAVAKLKRRRYCRFVERKQVVIAIVAAILAARKLSSVPPNSPAGVAAITDAVADARRIVDRMEKSSS
jgi:hypothetical protein